MSNVLVSLIPYVNGVKNKYLRFTVVRTSSCNIDLHTFEKQLIAKFGKKLGRSNFYTIRFTSKWGKNSILMDIPNFSVFEDIYKFVDILPGCIVDRTRYSLQPPMHLNTNGDSALVGTSVSYFLSSNNGS